MRRRRHELQVSTFPFLAVLLCAMGALLLVLLVMDRRAHDAARARADQSARRAAEEAVRDAETQRASLEQARQAARDARLQEREAEHARLQSQAAGVQGEEQSVRDQLARAADGLRDEQSEAAALKQKIDAEHAKAEAEQQAILQVRGEEAKNASQTEASRRELTEMTADLAQLEHALADLKAAREKEQKTYSVVPYNGKKGENRRPLYVECVVGGLVFHPDRLALPESQIASDAEAEVRRRLAAQKERIPPGQATAFAPYLMLLVRPDGVVSYYRFRDALRELKIDFGYEFIDADWALDFPAADEAPSPPWTTSAKPPVVAPSIPPSGPPLTGFKPGFDPFASAGAPTAPGHGGPAGDGAGTTAEVAPTPGPGGAPTTGAPPGHGSPGASIGSPSASRGPDRNGPPTGPVVAGPGNQAAPAGVGPGANRPPSAGSPLPPLPGPPGNPSGGAPGGASSAGPNSVAGGPPPVPGPPHEGAASTAAPPWVPKPGSTGTVAAQRPPSDGADEDPFLRSPPPPLPNTARPAPVLRPARLSGDRDWILYVECKPEGVVLYPTQLLVPTSALAHPSGSNPLLQTIQQLIDRKQATVRTGDASYRPEVRFLVHPDAGRTYHLAYPMLDGLAAPKTAQNLTPDDDVSAIVAGH